MNNEPVAWMNKEANVFAQHEDGARNFGCTIPLYTHPVKELNDGGEPVKNATYWKRQYNLMASQNDNLKSGLYHANEQIKYLESHPVKELTDEEIHDLMDEIRQAVGDDIERAMYRMARAILRKAQEK